MPASFNEIRRILCQALTSAMPAISGDIIDVYQDHCIISDGSGNMFEVAYSIDENNAVTLGEMAKVKKQIDYVRVSAASRLSDAVGQETDSDHGYKWAIQIIEAGPDKQGMANYPLEVLKSAAPLYEGAKVFALSQGQHAAPNNPYGKSVRDLVGWLSDIKPNGTGLEGIFNILKSAAWLRDMITDAWARGKKDIIGFSHDVIGKTVAGRSGPKDVERIVKVDSVDVVYDPIAGGKFLRMAAAHQGNEADQKKEAEMLEKLLAALRQQRPDLYDKIKEKVEGKTVTEDEVLDLLKGAMKKEGDPATPDGSGAASEAQKILDQARIIACGITLREELTASGLPEDSRQRLKKQFEKKVFETEVLRAAIKDKKEEIDKLTGDGRVTGAGGVRIVTEEPERVQAAMDKLFGVKVDDKFKDVNPFKSLRAAYNHMTGDPEVRGVPNRDGIRLGEAFMDFMRLPAAYSSSSFTYALGNTMYRRMTQDYKAVDYREDILLSYKRNARDFRTMESIRIGYFGDLADITPETVDYPEITMVTDEEIAYAINQKGGILTVTRKVIINDDLRTVQTLVSRVGRAAKRTYATRGWNKIINNATYDGDSVALFDAAHGNLGAVALSADAAGITVLTNRLVAMFNQTEKDAAKKLALEALYLWVPREVLETAKQLNSAWPGAAVANPHASRFGVNHERIVVNKLTTDPNDWGLVGDPNDVELLEVAFLNGQEEPELFVADNPLTGQMFVADKIQYKIRHEYEWEIGDYRGFDKSVVA